MTASGMGVRYARDRTSQPDPEVTSLLDAAEALLETLRRSLTQSERLLDRAHNGPSLRPEEARDVRAEINGTRAGIEQLNAMLKLRRETAADVIAKTPYAACGVYADGWICEEHPDQPWPHTVGSERCAGPGIPCECPAGGPWSWI